MRIGIGLGSNLGDRLHNLKQATLSIAKFQRTALSPLSSSIYLTQPVDCKDNTPSFYNMAIELDTDLEPIELLSQLRNIEKELGRPTQRERNASRTIDLDILYAGDLVIHSTELTLPHPRLYERRFVLQPLAEIRPDLILPGQNNDIATLLERLKSDEPPLEEVALPLFSDSLSHSC